MSGEPLVVMMLARALGLERGRDAVRLLLHVPAVIDRADLRVSKRPGGLDNAPRPVYRRGGAFIRLTNKLYAHTVYW